MKDRSDDPPHHERTLYPISGMVNIKEPLLLIRKGSPSSGGSGLPYVRRHITVNKMLKTFPSSSLQECLIFTNVTRVFGYTAWIHSVAQLYKHPADI